jgi:hypothetical protein
VQTLEEAHLKFRRGCQRKNAPTTKDTSGMLGKGLCRFNGLKNQPVESIFEEKSCKTTTILGKNTMHHGCRLKNQPSYYIVLTVWFSITSLKPTGAVFTFSSFPLSSLSSLKV